VTAATVTTAAGPGITPGTGRSGDGPHTKKKEA
jgi:hypothetical protein